MYYNVCRCNHMFAVRIVMYRIALYADPCFCLACFGCDAMLHWCVLFFFVSVVSPALYIPCAVLMLELLFSCYVALTLPNIVDRYVSCTRTQRDRGCIVLAMSDDDFGRPQDLTFSSSDCEVLDDPGQAASHTRSVGDAMFRALNGGRAVSQSEPVQPQKGSVDVGTLLATALAVVRGSNQRHALVDRGERTSKINRNSDLVSVQEDIGRKYIVARTTATVKDWARQWALREFPSRCSTDKDLRRFLQNARRCAERVQSLGAKQAEPGNVAPGRGVHGVCTHQVPLSKRRRRFGAGGPGLMKHPCIAEELFDWFVDSLQNVKGRMPSFLLLQQAKLVGRDLQEHWTSQVDKGETHPGCEPTLPVLDYGWLKRWRRLYGLSWRHVNLRYKCPRRLLLSRLKAFWCNILRIRFLLLYTEPESSLEFEDFDQKPCWFTAAGSEPTVAPRGASKVAVKENLPMTRARFTVMTRCRYPAPPHDKLIAVLFKAAGGGERIRKDLIVPDGVLLQFQEKGSYRLADVLEYLLWVVDKRRLQAKPEDRRRMARILYIADWFAPHLDPKVDELVHEYGHAIIRIGGHLTSLVQVPDTHAHGPYTNLFKKREMQEAWEQLEVRPNKIPSTSRQTVMNRALDSWMDVNHEKCSAGFVANGIANALDGSDDHKLTPEVVPFWHELDMPGLRAKLREEVRVALDTGKVTCFEDYHKLLEPYDEHKAFVEGQEAFGVQEVGADLGEQSDATVEGEPLEPDLEDVGVFEDDVAPPQHPSMPVSAPPPPDRDELQHQGPFGPCAAATADDDIVVAAGQGPFGPCAAALADSDIVLAASQAPVGPCAAAPSGSHLKDASDSMAADLEKQISSTRAALDASRSAGGDPTNDEFLARRLRSLLKRADIASEPDRVFLRSKALERQTKHKVERTRLEVDEKEKRALDLTVQLRKAEADIAKAKSKEQASIAKLALEAAQKEKRELAASQAKVKETEMNLATHFAAKLVARASTYLREGEVGRERVARCRRCASHAARRRVGINRLDTPRFWPPSIVGLLRVSQVGQFTRASGKVEVLYASPDFAWALFGKDPRKPTGIDPRLAFRNLLDRLLPGYFDVLGARYSMDALFAESRQILDLAYVAACYRYTIVVGEKFYRAGISEWPVTDQWENWSSVGVDLPNVDATTASSSVAASSAAVVNSSSAASSSAAASSSVAASSCAAASS